MKQGTGALCLDLNVYICSTIGYPLEYKLIISYVLIVKTLMLAFIWISIEILDTYTSQQWKHCVYANELILIYKVGIWSI